MPDERIDSLREILRKFLIEDFLSRKKWPGMEFAKATFGNMVLGAMEDIGLNRREELEKALEDAKKRMAT